MSWEIAVVLCLILINGVFAMSELALVSARRSRLRRMAADGSRGAEAALVLIEDTTRFLSTVQIGITAVAILAGRSAADGLAVLAELCQRVAVIPGQRVAFHRLVDAGRRLNGQSFRNSVILVGAHVDVEGSLLGPNQPESVEGQVSQPQRLQALEKQLAGHAADEDLQRIDPRRQ
jgi:CBS domain containing-hemolysin-like protein